MKDFNLYVKQWYFLGSKHEKSDTKKSRFIINQDASMLLSNLRIKNTFRWNSYVEWYFVLNV